MRFNFELLYSLVFVEIECDGGIAEQSYAADLREYKETILTSIFYEFFVGYKRVARKHDINNPLDRIYLHILCALFIPFDVPNAISKCENVRLEVKNRRFFVRDMIGSSWGCRKRIMLQGEEGLASA